MATLCANRADMALQSRLPFMLESDKIPLTYRLGNTVYHGIPQAFAPKMKRTAVDSNITEYTFTGTSPEGMTVSAELRVYHDFPVVEWVACFTNNTDEKSPILSDARWTTEIVGKHPVLYHSNGDDQTVDGFETYRDAITDEISLIPIGGQPCAGAFPYMRVCMDDWFVNLAIGWSGTWKASFAPTANGTSVSVGQARCHMTVLPGETMRTPTMLFMAASESDDHARNLWRKFYFAHLLPKEDGKPLPPKHIMHPSYPFNAESTESHLASIDNTLSHGFHPDIWWIDAGWYPSPKVWWASVGDWFADPERFPDGLAPIGKRCEENGIDFLLWFEPERVMPGTAIYNEHPEWLLPMHTVPDAIFDMGNPEAREWLTDTIGNLIEDYHISVYRQDFNQRPCYAWENAEAEDRIGAIENKHFQGYLAHWDALHERFPHLLIDSCASGGRRNELETMRRSVPFHYSDVGYGHHPIKQRQSRLMFEWIPFFRTAPDNWDYPDGHYATGKEPVYMREPDAFGFHGALTPAIGFVLPMDATEETCAIRHTWVPIWRRAAEIELRADYYPLTECRKDPHDWYAMQFDDPDEGDGFFQVVRNTQVEGDTFVVQMKAVRTDKTYLFENAETGVTMTLTGVEVAKGIPLTLPLRSGSLWFYHTEE